MTSKPLSALRLKRSSCNPYPRLGAVSIIGLLIAGCATEEIGKAPTRLDSHQGRYVKDGKRIQSDPVAFLRELCARCDGWELHQRRG